MTDVVTEADRDRSATAVRCGDVTYLRVFQVDSSNFRLVTENNMRDPPVDGTQRSNGYSFNDATPNGCSCYVVVNAPTPVRGTKKTGSYDKSAQRSPDQCQHQTWPPELDKSPLLDRFM